MKKIINHPEQLVLEMCRGMAQAHPGLKLLEQHKIVTRKTLDPHKVSLISGGGSGHEPAHAGFVGTGMLDAAVCGDVFASPSQIQIYNAIKATRSEKGTLLIIKNYSGDMMNFKNAAVLAEEDGIRVEYVRVDDDIAVQDSLYTVGRRGVAGTVLVHKIAGAAAERGNTLDEVKALAERTISNVKTIGFALTSCTVPAKGTPTFELGKTEMEYGVGIHGEPGVRREALQSADELARRMVDSLLAELSPASGAEVAVLVNGMGGTPLQELYVLNASVQTELVRRGVRAVFTLVGNYMTSIDMAGASLSILKLDEELKQLLLAPCDTSALKRDSAETVEPGVYTSAVTDRKPSAPVNYGISTEEASAKIVGERLTLQNIIYLVDAMSACVIANEVAFCELDSYAGDGDFGMSVAKGFRRLKEGWTEMVGRSTTIGEFLDECAVVIMEHCGGASGPIWGSAFRAAGKCAAKKTELTAQEFAELLRHAANGIRTTGERSFGRGAEVGDKTLMDAFLPCVDTWEQSALCCPSVTELFAQGAKAAVEGAKRTEQIVARMGRAGTVGERSLGYPDAGAHALGVIFTDLANRLK